MKLFTDQEGNEWLLTVVDYWDAYVWLTTIPANQLWIKEEDKFFTGLHNAPASVTFEIPTTVKDPKPKQYWNCYTWLWTTYIGKYGEEFMFYYHGPNCIHFKMFPDALLRQPPIPKFLYEFYHLYKDKINHNPIFIDDYLRYKNEINSRSESLTV